MPQQLIYTSAPRGVVAGRSGYCTVARTASMREALMLQLERFCYYQHLSLSGGTERPIFSCRMVDIRGTRYHVVSRMQDAGLDFTGRTNFIAHHLVFTPEEIRQYPTPPVILRDWPGWVKSWSKEPELLENENWAGLGALATRTNIPAQTWQQVTGDATNGYGLLEARVGASFRVDDLGDDVILALVAESLELMDVRDPRRDFRSVAWNYTFTTSMQEQDNPADFRWRCLHSDNPAANRLATPDCRALSAVRATKLTGEETAFARTGRQPPRFVTEPADLRVTEGQPVQFTARAEGVPAPTYQWYKCDKEGKETELLNGQASAELSLDNPPVGVTRYRVWASNSLHNAQSRLAALSVERQIRLVQNPAVASSRQPTKPTLYDIKSEEDIERQRLRLESESAQEIFQQRLRRNKIIVTILTIALIAVAGVFVWEKLFRPQLPARPATALTSDLSNPPTSVQSFVNNATVSSGKPPVEPAHNPPPTAFSLPDEWKPMVIGLASNINAECISVKGPPRFDLSTAATGFSTNGDSVFFVCKTNNGSEFKATLLRIDSPTIEHKCGVMIRESQKGDSPFLFIGASSEKIITCCRSMENKFFSCEMEMPKASLGMPVFLKFDQFDKQYVPSYSFDAKTWGTITNYTMSTAARTMVGYAISSGSSSRHVTAHFVDVSPK